MKKMPRLGHTLLLLGTLIYGANIGLMAQIFHIDGDSWRMFAAWSLGAAAMGYLVQSSPIMLISVVTLTISFFSHSSHDHIYFIFAGAVISLPFAYWKKDKLIFTAGLISMALFSIFALNDGYSLFSVTALIFLFLGFFASSNGRYDQFKKISLVLSFTAVTISAFFFSFQDVAEDMVYISETVKISSLLLLTSITLLAAGLVMLLAGWKKTVAEKFNRNNLIFLVICGIVPAISFFTVDFVLVVLSNVILIAVTGILIFNSMQTNNARSPYWLGVSVLAATILARTVEYETGLLIKSAVFIATGIGFIIAGIIMEKYLKKRGATA